VEYSDSLYESTAKWRLLRFSKRPDVDAKLGGASVTKTATLLRVSRAAVSRDMMTDTNHRRTSSTKRNDG